MEWLNIVAKHHKEWVAVAKSWGLGDISEDLVQEMYLRLYERATPEKFITDGHVNKFYVYVTLRNMFNDIHREKKKFDKVRIGEGFEIKVEQDEELEKKEGFDKLCERLEYAMGELRWYDRMLLKLYVNTGMSMRDIEEGTNISLTSIFHTIKKSKNQVKEILNEDMQDYDNEDYHLL